MPTPTNQISRTKLFNRIRRITVGNLDVSHLDVSFKVRRTLNRSANTAELTVYNLSRNHLEQIKNQSINREILPIEIAAGYEADVEPQILFRGFATRDLTVSIENTETVLKLKATDRLPANRARSNRTYAQRTGATTVVNDLIQDLGLEAGNALEHFSDLNFQQGFVAFGNALTNFDRIVRSQDLSWSTQNGEILILTGAGTSNRGIGTSKLLNQSSGLIGTPVREKNNKVSLKVLIQSGLDPGRRIRLESVFINGDFLIKEAVWNGSTVGPTWHVDIVAQPNT